MDREKVKKHRHHIKPKHAGGSDDEDNLVDLTVEEHAEAHRLLWEKYGSKWDYIAWKTLSGRMTNEEARIAAAKEGRRLQAERDKLAGVKSIRRKQTPEEREANRQRNLGRKHTEETKSKCSEAGKKSKGVSKSEDHRKALSEAAKRRSKVKCEHCGQEISPQMFKRWHGDQCKSTAKSHQGSV